MSEQGKARHFKLTVDYDGFLPKLFFNNFVVPSNFKNREQLTVIEYSAFEQFQKENEALKAKLEEITIFLEMVLADRDKFFDLYQEENEKLQKCVKALEFYGAWETWSFSKNEYPDTPLRKDSDGEGFIPGNLARQTLKEIED